MPESVVRLSSLVATQQSYARGAKPLIRGRDRPASKPVGRVPGEAVALLAEDHESCGLDVNREQVVPGLVGSPPDAGHDRLAIDLAESGVLLVDRPPVKLEIVLRSGSVGRAAVHDAPRIAQEVDRLRRA